MHSNIFGKALTMTTWGESHGPMIGVVIDGVPANLAIDVSEINTALALRAPGNSPFTSPRKELDVAHIVSGLFEGKTTGAPISILINNQDADSSKYTVLKNKYRPGHADYTYSKKYKNYDYRGGGRASARETAGRVAAGVIANKILAKHGITANAYLQQIKDIAAPYPIDLKDILPDVIFCCHAESSLYMQELITQAKAQGDSLGGIVAFQCDNVPVGLGEPIYDKMESRLAHAMLSIPASKGFEIGSGFQAAKLNGSEHNDLMHAKEKHYFSSNHSGGVLAGITNGNQLYGRVAFKPTSSIMQPQATLNKQKQATTLTLPTGSRHDPCVAIRAVPVVQAMCQLVLADFLLLHKLIN